MVASRHLFAAGILDDRQASHFAAPVDDGRVEQAARLEVNDERGGPFVYVFAGGG